MHIVKSKRVRSTPYTSRIEKQGVSAYTTYNHMLLPAGFELPIQETYYHLKEHVQIWDVAAERQVEITGPDSAKLIQLMTCRDLSKSKDGRCYYCPIIDDQACMVNDPIILRINQNKWWISIADSDVILFAKGLAIGKKYDVNIIEPNVDIMAVQGPKSFALMEKVFGKSITELKFFGFDFYDFKGVKHLISRSGWSKQGGYEIYVENTESGLELYDYLFEIGKEFNVRPGCPHYIERIESGLLSYGNDINSNHNPYEAGLGKLLSNGISKGCLAYEKLTSISNPTKMIKPIEIIGDPIQPITYNSKVTNIAGDVVGQISSAAWSPDFKVNVAIGMIDSEYWKQDENLFVEILENDKREIIIKDKFWS